MNLDQLKLKVWRTAWIVGTVLIALFAALTVKELAAIGHVGDQAPVNTIAVTGSGDVTVIPDIATFSFTVTETTAAVDTAQKAAAQKVNAAIAALKKAGVADKDIRTLSYNINPHYEYKAAEACPQYSCPPSNPVLTGYDVSQTVEVKVRDITQAGTLFSTVGSLGVQNQNNLAFSVDNLKEVQDQARDLAIADARKQAGKLAAELGVRIVRVVSFSDNSYSPQPYPMYERAYSADAGSAKSVPEIPAGQQKITDAVSVTYEIR